MLSRMCGFRRETLCRIRDESAHRVFSEESSYEVAPRLHRRRLVRHAGWRTLIRSTALSVQTGGSAAKLSVTKRQVSH